MGTTRRTFLKSAAMAIPAASALAAEPGAATDTKPSTKPSLPAHVDVLVYGATPAGIAAAVAVRRDGRSVLLVDEYRWVGGLITNGLTHTDFRTFEGVTGFFREFADAVVAHYAATYGPESPQAKGCFRGTHMEPKVARAVFEKMLADHSVTVFLQRRLRSVDIYRSKGVNKIDSVNLDDGAGGVVRVSAKVFIDATYEGDLMAAAGVEWVVGREGREQYGESLAPEQPDDQLQAYNFRLTMTNVPENRVMPEKPAGYDRTMFLPVLPLLNDGTIKSVYCDNAGGIYKRQTPPLPNGKADINDVSKAPVRLSMPGANLGWPNGSAEERRRIFDEHVRYNLGLLYFLQNDPAVPVKFRKEAREWGWCRDEFVENGHVPEQLYVREARRMKSRVVFTQKHVDPDRPDELRAPVCLDSIAMGDYGPNCHGTGHVGPLFGGKHVGEFYHPSPPYGVPYETIVAREVDNLLVVGAVASSHVGFCALRLEPIWAGLGQAAGHAAAWFVAGRTNTRQIGGIFTIGLQRRLWQVGAATAYVSDVLSGHKDFAAVQWWATAGGFHGQGANGLKPGTRGKQIVGQYFEAFPGHAADLDKPLDDATRARWVATAQQWRLPEDQMPKQSTRGEFIRHAWIIINQQWDAGTWKGRVMPQGR